MMAAVDGYLEFLEAKKVSSPSYGFDPGDEVSDVLFGFQRDIARWAVAGGRRAIFAAFGLGKSLMQLECMRLVGNREGGRQLIICPLGVRQEFKRDAKLLDMEPVFVRRSEEVAGYGLYLTNYESARRQDGKPTANLAWWCEVRRALGDCRFECKGYCWCEHVRRAHYGSMGEGRLRIRS